MPDCDKGEEARAFPEYKWKCDVKTPAIHRVLKARKKEKREGNEGEGGKERKEGRKDGKKE